MPAADLALRSYLGAHGMKKGDLSKFIEDAVRWRLFDQTVTAIKARTDPEELVDLVNATVRNVRRERARGASNAKY